MDARSFETLQEGTSYALPVYSVVEGLGLSLTDKIHAVTFVRGSKATDEGDIPKVDGVIHESLLSCMIADLQFKNNLLPSRETATAITHLQTALMWMEERTRARAMAGVLGTYKNIENK